MTITFRSQFTNEGLRLDAQQKIAPEGQM